MIQTYIIREDIDPITAARTSEDVSICGGCVHRNQQRDPSKTMQRTCYVNLGHGPNRVYKKLKSDRPYPVVRQSDLQFIGVNRFVRVGTYGDPVAVPLHIWRKLLSRAKGHTGYTHQWRSKRLAKGYSDFIMASCESPEEARRAREAGWGTFTVYPVGTKGKGMHCPASSEAGKKKQCQDCLVCNGRKKEVWINAHGPSRTKFEPKVVQIGLVN